MLPKPEKFDIDKLVNVPNGLNNSNIKLNDLDVETWNVSVNLKQLSYVVSREVDKNTKFNKGDTKVKHLENF